MKIDLNCLLTKNQIFLSERNQTYYVEIIFASYNQDIVIFVSEHFNLSPNTSPCPLQFILAFVFYVTCDLDDG